MAALLSEALVEGVAWPLGSVATGGGVRPGAVVHPGNRRFPGISWTTFVADVVGVLVVLGHVGVDVLDHRWPGLGATPDRWAVLTCGPSSPTSLLYRR